MKYTVKLFHRNVPDEVLLADLRKTAKKLGKKHVPIAEYDKEGEYSPATLFERFGSWNAALLKAGLKVKHKSSVSNIELLLNLKNVWDVLDRQPCYDDMRKPLSKYSPVTYKRRFSSWNEALLTLEKAVKNGVLNKSKKAGDKKQIHINPYSFKAAKCGSKNFGKTHHVSKCMRFDVLKRDNFRCRVCGASPANDPKVTLHVDHIIPVSKGGETILSNLQTLCQDCNLGKGNKTMNNGQ